MSKPNIYDEKFSERMKFIAEKSFKSNYSEFARAVGVAQASLARWVKGEADPSRSNLVKIAEVSGASLEWLATGKEQQPQTSQSIVGKAFQQLEVMREEAVSMIDSFVSIHVSAGFGSFNEGVTKPDGQEPYADSLLHSLGVQAKHCAVFWASGSSMQPTITDGDQLLVDLSRNEVRGDDKIYLVQNGDSVWVKRVKMLWDGVELISDNREEYEPIKISNQEAQNLQIIGQVVHVGHKLI
ncbi:MULTISPECIES: S24 family peptidase [Actinobacillus]|uniref:Phage repressor n=1 Tax=Actinobacillus equuli TaxID=718 RepID=A0AAX3FLF8_ACTEU|nr:MULTISPECIES: helix-turn-helix transcriptional regulator [Actinobacillus]AIZ78790.1 transcriptional regulator [Actinobacillus equuli subsp. equuli]WGE45051.1 helix-turn-helix transcriptional regulator [Actinobacillus equuli subsp. equuli]VEE93016.1 putative phage repressor [Actinobacillus equuli]